MLPFMTKGKCPRAPEPLANQAPGRGAVSYASRPALPCLPVFPPPRKYPTKPARPASSSPIAKGRTLYEAIDPNGNKQVPVPLDEIPLACRQATIATEDSRFYEHPGVDLLGIARALWQNWRTGETISGASTLTQQLARNLYLSRKNARAHAAPQAARGVAGVAAGADARQG